MNEQNQEEAIRIKKYQPNATLELTAITLSTLVKYDYEKQLSVTVTVTVKVCFERCDTYTCRRGRARSRINLNIQLFKQF